MTRQKRLDSSLANNNGNIIGGDSSGLSGVWGVQDVYNRVRRDEWSKPFEPIDLTENLLGTWISPEDLTVSEVRNLVGTTYWTSTFGQVFDYSERYINFGNSSGSPGGFEYDVSDTNTSEYSDGVAQMYFPLTMGKNTTHAFFNRLPFQTAPEALSSDGVSIAILVGFVDTPTNIPIFSTGTGYQEAASSSSTHDRLELYTESGIIKFHGGSTGSNVSTGEAVSINDICSIIITFDAATSAYTYNVINSDQGTNPTDISGSGSMSGSAGSIDWTNPGDTLFGQCRIGGSNAASTLLTNGSQNYTVYDFAMWQKVIDSDEIDKIQSYHKHKYGVIDLPAAHAYDTNMARTN